MPTMLVFGYTTQLLFMTNTDHVRALLKLASLLNLCLPIVIILLFSAMDLVVRNKRFFIRVLLSMLPVTA